MTGVFADYARFYDALYHDKDYAAEAEYFLGLVDRYQMNPSKTILEFGAGSGGHQSEFVARGYDAIGVEPSEDMRALATQRGSRVVDGDFKDYSSGSTFDVVMALFHVVSYLTTDEDLDQGFQTARSHLKPKGLFIFDVWNEDAVIAQRPETRVKRIKDGSIEILRIAEPIWRPERKTVEVNYTLFARTAEDNLWEHSVESHLMRYFSPQDLHNLASKAGFDVLVIEETITSMPTTSDSWGITAVLRAR